MEEEEAAAAAAAEAGLHRQTLAAESKGSSATGTTIWKRTAIIETSAKRSAGGRQWRHSVRSVFCQDGSANLTCKQSRQLNRRRREDKIGGTQTSGDAEKAALCSNQASISERFAKRMLEIERPSEQVRWNSLILKPDNYSNQENDCPQQNKPSASPSSPSSSSSSRSASLGHKSLTNNVHSCSKFRNEEGEEFKMVAMPVSDETTNTFKQRPKAGCNDNKCQQLQLQQQQQLSYTHPHIRSSKFDERTTTPADCEIATSQRCRRRRLPSMRNRRQRSANNEILSFGLLVIVLTTLVCGWLMAFSNQQVSAYQLANNLIANNLPPKFITGTSGAGTGAIGSGVGSNSEIVVRVKEGSASIGKLIYTLKGEDPDDDPLTFGVLGSLASDLLRIENVPGNQANVYLRKELDRETTESYQVVITLTDGKLGRGNWITKSMLIIVEDVNDNYPVFGPHRTAINIREDVKVPLVIETIEATDQDEGRFGQVIYKLDETDDNSAHKGGSQVSSMFSIETIDGKGVISLMNPLDYEQKPLYQLRVLAIDRAIEHERLTATTSILISVEDCEDRPPMFTFVPSITRIPENLSVGSAIVRVAAIDGDRGINNPIQYKLVSINGRESGPDRHLFDINPETGLISVAQELNRESDASNWPSGDSWLQSDGSSSRKEQQNSNQPGSYVLQVSASEVGSSSKDNTVTTELTIILTDVNDEIPTFNQAAYYGEILENSAPDNLVSFIWRPPGALGNLESQQQQQLQSQQAPSAKVIDRDQGTNGTFTLYLEGEHSQLFDIWPSEATNEANIMIKVGSLDSGNLQLDYERIKMFQFKIIAKEKFNNGQQLRYNSASMTVYLKDSNDNYPQFESELYRVEIPEKAIRGMHVCAVKASDADSGSFGTQGIRYTEIRGEKANKFKLDPLTGVITLKTNDHGFDRETIGQHHLIVEARDSNGSGNRNTTQLLIILTDVNDQKPKFLLDQYEAFIYENELDFQSPLQVQAVDNDAQNTPNSRITYSIVGGDPHQNFTIDPQTGRIRVRSSLVVSPMSTSTSSSSRGQHQTSANHNQLTGSSEGVGGDFNQPASPAESEIVLESGAMSTGSVVAQASGLDFERIAQKRDDTRHFNLTVRATDSGSPEALADLAHVIILVYDRNDHAPVFTRNVYSKSIREDTKEGSQVLQVLAQDGDHSPTHSKITYRISSGASDKFVIDSDSGLISVANGANLDIDRVVGGQKRTNYLLNVIAFDGSFGPNQKSASALVNITIIDVNNKPPEFITLGGSRSPLGGTNYAISPATTISPSSQQQQQLMVVYVNEDAPYGLIVTRVIAMDLDSGSDLRYSINYARSEVRNEDMVLLDPSIIKDLFSIEPVDGTIKVAKQLDRELFDQVKLRLQVEDIAAQTSEQIAHAYLLVKITDVNDNRPVFKKQIYKAVVNENSISGTSLITLTADDRDLNKTLKYSLDGSPEMMRLIRINPRSGEVTVNDKIDRELYPMINVTVKAEDYGHPHPLTGTAQLIVTVRDENDNNPMFLNSSQLMHNWQANLDHSLAAHSSGSFNQDLNYKNHNMHDQAALNSSTYRLRSLGPHRFDAHGVASAGLDHLPDSSGLDMMLAGGTYEGARKLPLLSPGATERIREDAPVGYQVAYVLAEDADVGNNGRVTYLIDAQSSGGKFRIDRDSGIISVASQLDRETVKQYSLIIEACDNYDLGYSTGESRRAFTQVNILVTDINDNAPVISTNLQSPIHHSFNSLALDQLGMNHPTYDDIMNSPGPYQVPLTECLFISEFQQLNEPILTITATDADDPSTPNGQMDLAIINNLPHKELFGLVSVQANGRLSADLTRQASATTDRSTPSYNRNDYSGFGDLALGETSLPPSSLAGAAATASAHPGSRLASDSTDTIVEDGDIAGEDGASNRGASSTGRPKRSASLMEPVALGNLYSRAHSGNSGYSTTSGGGSSSRQTGLRQTYRSPFSDTSDHVGGGSPPPAPATTEQPPAAGLVMSATMASVRHPSNQNLDGGEQQVHIVVLQSFKERVGNYSILVRATDRGQPSLSSVKLINICVQDVNNHSPVFVRPPLNHTIRVMENATIGTYVSQVEATDLDHGLNGELQYSLKQTNIHNNNNDWESFKIDRLSGVITTAKHFNRQLKKYYTLRVQAQDFGRPTSLSSDIDINIMIVNSGRYQPEFDTQTQSFQFTENVAPGIEWFTLLSTTNLDDDPALINVNLNQQANGDRNGSNSGSGGSKNNPASWLTSPCYFIIDSDDQEQIFHLDRYTHRLSNQRTIDREKKANYTLLVQATNNCNKPPMYTRHPIESVRPMLSTSGEFDYRASSSEVNGLIKLESPRSLRSARASVPVSSTWSAAQSMRDKKSIEQQQQHRLPISYPVPIGSANSTRQQQQQQQQQQQGASLEPAKLVASAGDGFNHAAVDALIAADKSLLKVVIKIKDVNDNAPKFTQRVYTGGITTEADFGTVFMIVQANDPDSDANGQVTYSTVKPIKRNLVTSPVGSVGIGKVGQLRQKRSPSNAITTTTTVAPSTTSTTVQPSNNNNNNLVNFSKPDFNSENDSLFNDIPMNEGDDLFVINPQTGEISLNFDPQKHMKGYFEFEIMANDTDGLFDSAKVFIYLLRQDQRVKFVLRLTPQELRQRLNKFRSVFGNITGAIVNIDSYKYYENHDGTVDKKKTSLYLHFVNPEDNTIIDVDKVLTLIDNNIEYLDELYKEFHVLSSEAAHLPLSSSALIDPIDQIRTGLMGVTSFLALILVLVIALCLNQRTRYERQLKAATVSAFGSSPLHLDPDLHSQTNLPNTNLHSQDPNPIWMNGYSEQDWLGAATKSAGGAVGMGGAGGGGQLNGPVGGHANHHHGVLSGVEHLNQVAEDGDYLSSGNSDLNSLSGVNSVGQLHYNHAATATPRDSLNSSHGRVSGSGSGSTSTTNDRQALCRGAARQSPSNQHRADVHHSHNQYQQQQQQQQVGVVSASTHNQNRQLARDSHEVVGVLKNGANKMNNSDQTIGKKQRQQQPELTGNTATSTHSTFGAFKEVTIYTDHNQQAVQTQQFLQQQQQQQHSNKQVPNNLVRANNQQQPQTTSQVNKIASQFNAKHQQVTQSALSSQLYIGHPQQQQQLHQQQQDQTGNKMGRQRIIVHANGADVNQGIIKTTTGSQPSARSGLGKLSHHQQQQQQLGTQIKHPNSQIQPGHTGKLANSNHRLMADDMVTNTTITQQQQQQQLDRSGSLAADNFETNLSKLSILNLETTEL